VVGSCRDSRVSFILIGSQKSGTTSLSRQLAQHPQISFSRHKEPNFFSDPIPQLQSEADYHALFAPGPDLCRGEASTTYTWLPQYPETAQRIHDYNPDMKLLYIMRQPVERIRSHYTHRMLRARTQLPQEEEVLANPIYVNRSRYAMQLRPYLALFPRESLYPIVLEEYSLDPLRVLHAIALHLGIEPGGFDGVDLTPQYRSTDRLGDTRLKRLLKPVRRHVPQPARKSLRRFFVYRPKVLPTFSEETKRLLWRLVELDVVELERIMGREIPLWRRPPYRAVGDQ